MSSSGNPFDWNSFLMQMGMGMVGQPTLAASLGAGAANVGQNLQYQRQLNNLFAPPGQTPNPVTVTPAQTPDANGNTPNNNAAYAANRSAFSPTPGGLLAGADPRLQSFLQNLQAPQGSPILSSLLTNAISPHEKEFIADGNGIIHVFDKVTAQEIGRGGEGKPIEIYNADGSTSLVPYSYYGGQVQQGGSATGGAPNAPANTGPSSMPSTSTGGTMGSLPLLLQTGGSPSAAIGPAAPPALHFGVRQAESNGNPNAVGPYVPGQGTAKSDMQVMDKTNADPGFGVTPARDNSSAERSRVGSDYLDAMWRRYQGDPTATAAAYIMGPGNFDKWRAQNGTDYSRLPPSVQAYVASVNRHSQSAVQNGNVQPGLATAPRPSENGPIGSNAAGSSLDAPNQYSGAIDGNLGNTSPSAFAPNSPIAPAAMNGGGATSIPGANAPTPNLLALSGGRQQLGTIPQVAPPLLSGMNLQNMPPLLLKPRPIAPQASPVAASPQPQPSQAPSAFAGPTRDPNTGIITGGGGIKPQDRFGAPTTLEVGDGKGGTRQVLAMQDRLSRQWVTADQNQTPIDATDARVIPPNMVGGGRSQVQMMRIVNAASELAPSLTNLARMPSTASTGFFGGRSQGGSLLDAGKETLTNTLTTQDVQGANVVMLGIARNLATLESAGSGNVSGFANQMQGNLLKEGDTFLTKAMKLAQMRQDAEQSVEATISSPNIGRKQIDVLNKALTQIRQAVPWTVPDVMDLQYSANPQATLKDIAGTKGLGGNRAQAGSAPRPANGQTVLQYDASGNRL